MKKIELIIDTSQSNELEYLISKFNISFYKNELHVKDHLTRIQYMIFAPDTTTRKIMKEIKKIFHTNQKDTIMVIPEIETTFSNYLDQIEDKDENKESPKLREEFHALTEPAVEFRRDLLFVVIITSAAALVPPASVIGIGLAMLDADILIGASICHVLLVFHI